MVYIPVNFIKWRYPKAASEKAGRFFLLLFSNFFLISFYFLNNLFRKNISFFVKRWKRLSY